MKTIHNNVTCSDAVTGYNIEKFDLNWSQKIAEILENDFKKSFKTIQDLIADGLFDNLDRVAEGFIVVNGIQKPIMHSWIINSKQGAVIDPIAIKMGLSSDNISYFIGFTYGVMEFINTIEWGNFSIGTPYFEVFSNDNNMLQGRMGQALITALLMLDTDATENPWIHAVRLEEA